MKARVLTPELLDSLPPNDLAAQASRRDLRRLHPLLGQIGLWTRWFAEKFPARPPASLADLGAGDGSLLGTVLLRAYPKGGHGARIFFVDRQPVVPESTLAHLRRCNWLPTVMATDIFEWAEEGPPMEAALANLFLHHFDNPGIKRLFSALARKTSSLVLRHHGNMSSPSCLFALDHALRNGVPDGLWWLASFGAGFSSFGAFLEVRR